jgi:hypothetical protein
LDPGIDVDASSGFDIGGSSNAVCFIESGGTVLQFIFINLTLKRRTKKTHRHTGTTFLSR